MPALAETKIIISAGHDTAAAVSVVPTDNESAFICSGTWSMLGCRVSQPYIPDALIRSGWALFGLAGGQWGLFKGIAGLWLIQECRRIWMRAGTALSFAEMVESARPYVPAHSLIDPEFPGFQAPADMSEAIRDCCRQTGQAAPASASEIAATIFTSLALDYRVAFHELRQATGRSFKTVWIVGGGNRNQVLNQLASDALGVPVMTGPSEAAAIGNLLLQAQLLEIVSNAEHRGRLVEAADPSHRYDPQSDWAARLYPQFLEIKRRSKQATSRE